MVARGRNRLTDVLRRLESDPDHAGHTFGPRSEYRLRVASSIEDRIGAWRLAYRAYRQKEYVAPNVERLWYSLHDALPEAVTVLAECGDEIIGAVTVVPDSPLGLPADRTFPGVMRDARARGGRLAEAVSMVQAGISERAGIAVIGKLCEFTCLVGQWALDCTDLVITVNPRHERYYRKVMLFERRGELRDCGRVGGAPAVFLTLNFETMNGYVRSALRCGSRNLYRRFMSPERARREGARIRRSLRPMGEAALRNYFLEKRPLLAEASLRARHHIEDCYPCYDLTEACSDTREYLPV